MAKILAADDSLSIRNMVELTIDETDHDLQIAEDGQIAFEKAQAEKFDLIITDINMPNMDGFELIQSVRALDAYRTTPILCITTESGKDLIGKGRELGATGWIVKPFSPDKLLSIIGRLI